MIQSLVNKGESNIMILSLMKKKENVKNGCEIFLKKKVYFLLRNSLLDIFG